MSFVDSTFIVLGFAFLISLLFEILLISLAAMFAYKVPFDIKNGFKMWLMLLAFKGPIIILSIFVAKGLGLVGGATV